MSSATKDLLVRFDRLTGKEKAVVSHEILRGTAHVDSRLLDDMETSAAAEIIFSMLDKEEADSPADPHRLATSPTQDSLKK